MILQDKVVTALLEAQPLLGVGQGEAMLRRWFVEDKGATEVSFDFTVTVTKCDYCCY